MLVVVHDASASSSTTKIKHEVPGKKYIPGFRINLDVEISNETKLLATRCYFKTKNDKNFAFVDLFHRDGELYKAILPAPFVNSEEVNYLFVVVNNKKQVSRTELFTLEEEDSKEATTWKDIDDVKNVRLDRAQDIAEKYVKLYDDIKSNYVDKLPDYQTTGNDKLDVKIELSPELVPLKGFYDLATITEIPAAAKFGFLADGLYSAADIAAAGGSTSTGATSAGTVSVSSGGMSTSTVVLIGVAGAAAIGGGIAIASSGGGGGGHHDDGTPPTQPGKPLDSTTILGPWKYSGHRHDGVARSGRMNFSNNGSYTWTIVDADGQSNGSGSGRWTLSGTHLTLNFDTGKRWSGTANGNSLAFDFINTGHGNYHYTR
jgi:hypothetical protein